MMPTTNESSDVHYPPSDIDILVVGGGVGGLYFSMEAIRNGHSVRIIEAKAENQQVEGDFFVIGPSAIRSFKHWPAFHKEFEYKRYDTWMKFSKHSGEPVLDFTPYQEQLGNILLRRDLQDMLLGQLQRYGVQISYGDKVVEYMESDTNGQVRLESGALVTADLVVAADGVHSRSWKLIKGTKEEPVSSGFSIFRASMSAERALSAGPAVIERFFSQRDTHETLEFFAGPNTHGNILFGKGKCCWLLLHKDSIQGSSSESWANTISAEDALRIINETPGWDMTFKQLVAVSPPIIDWRLMIRNPQPTWVSPLGRVIQVGDAAHPFLPTSANGATQAMEDGTSLAVSLRLGGNVANIPHACRVHNVLRFERVSCAQLLGLVNREAFHKTDWDMVARDPTVLLKVVPGKWIGQHDVEKYTLDSYGACLASLQNPKSEPFVSTNGPPGYKYEPWDALTIMANAEEGKRVVTGGDWT